MMVSFQKRPRRLLRLAVRVSKSALSITIIIYFLQRLYPCCVILLERVAPCVAIKAAVIWRRVPDDCSTSLLNSAHLLRSEGLTALYHYQLAQSTTTLQKELRASTSMILTRDSSRITIPMPLSFQQCSLICQILLNL